MAQEGTICCTINPFKIKQFVKWSLTPSPQPTTWFESGTNVKIPYGTYYLQTTPVYGWTVSKKDDAIIINSDKEILISIDAIENGNLRIKLESKNIKDVARWRPINTSIWYMDNEEISLYPNTYEIEFKYIENYATPINQMCKVYENEVTMYSFTPYLSLGSLQIVFKENVILESIGEPLWRIKNTSTWKKSGETLFLIAKEYIIEFNTVGVFTHEDYIVLIENEKTILKEIEFLGINLFIIPTKSNINFYNFNNFQKLNILTELSSFTDTNQVATNYNDTLLAIAHNDSPYLTIYNLINYDVYFDKQLIKPLSGCRSLDFSNDGQYLAVSYNNFPFLSVYKTSDWTQITLSSLPLNYCNTVQFSHNSLYLAVGFDKDPFLNIYYMPLAVLITTNIIINREIFSFCFDYTDIYLAIGCDRKVYIYNIITCDLIPIGVFGTVYGVQFFNDYLIIVSSLYFYIYHYEKSTDTYIVNNKILTPIPNINNHITISPDQKYIIIGCNGYPYIIIYETTNWTQVAFDSMFLDYCKKSVVTGDLSTRAYVNIPINKFPLNNHKGLRENEPLVSSDFSYFLTSSDTHTKSQWRILNEYESIVYDSGICDDLISHLIPESYFETPINYFWQVRHQGDILPWSFWSKLTSFSVLHSYIKKPVNILPVDVDINVIENPTLTSTNFEVINASDTHVFSEWIVYKRVQGLDVQKYSSGAITDFISHTVPKGIIEGSTSGLQDMIYVWQVRHQGSQLSWSDLSDKTSFTTGVWKIDKPLNISPNDNEEDINTFNLTLSSSKFTVLNTTDTHTHTNYEIYDSGGIIINSGELIDTRENTEITYIVPIHDKLVDGEILYTWKIKYKGLYLGWSEWSDLTTFKTQVLQTSDLSIRIYPTEVLRGKTLPLRWYWRIVKSDLTSSDLTSPQYISSLLDTGDLNVIKIPANKIIMIDFEPYKSILKPAPIIITNTIADNYYTYDVMYGLLLGSIQCNITGYEYGRWKLLNTDGWRDSGYVETNLPWDNYEIEFEDITGYITPSNIKNIFIYSDSETAPPLIIKTAQYEIDDSEIYYVVVNIDRGQWKLNSNSTLYNSDDKVSLFGISLDSIVFSDVDGYITPNDITFQIPNTYINDETTHYPGLTKTLLYTRKYTLDNIGQLRCNLSPGYAKWKLSTSTILNNTTTILDLVAGTYIINFENIGGYKPIVDETNVVVVANETTTISKNYILEPSIGNLKIELNPLTARYKVKDVDKWYDSNNIYPMLIGTYIIEFEIVENYTTPVNKSVTINKDELTTLIVKYVPSIKSKSIKLIVKGIDYKINKVQYRTRYSLTKDLWSSWTDRIQYYTVDGLNDIISDLKLGFYEIDFSQFTYFQFMSHKIVEFKGEDIISTFTYVGSTDGGYGSIGIIIKLIDSNSDPIQDTSILTNLLEYQHVEISDDIYNNKDASKIIWSDNWVKSTDINSIITSLSKTTKHAYKIKSIDNYFNLGDTGNISYVSLDIHTSITLSFIKYEFTNIYFGLPYLSNINDAKSGFVTPEIPDVTSFNISFRTKNEFEDKFDGNLKTILINGHIELYTIYSLTYQIFKSDNITLTDLFGCNQLGYISIVNFTVNQTGTTTTSIPYNPKTLIALNGLNLSALLSINIQQNPPTQSSYVSVYQSPLTLHYCSSDSNGGAYGEYPCTTSYRHTISYTGFKDQWNPNDPIHRCQQAPGTICPVDPRGVAYSLNLSGSNAPSDLFRYYLPKGTMGAELILYGLPSDGEGVTLARLGSPPTSTFPNSYDQFNVLEKYPDIFPPSLYPDIRSFWNGKTIAQLKQNDWFAINQGGHITVLRDGIPLTESNWLYINFNSYDASRITIHTYVWYGNESLYTEWYNNYTGSWLANGDPPEYF